MSDEFSDNKAPHQGGFQQMSDKNYNTTCLNVLGGPNFINSCDQHSIRNIPSQNRSMSLSQLPLPPMPPPLPPPPPRLLGPVFNAGNILPSGCYSYPPPSNCPPPRPKSYTSTDFSVPPRQLNLQNPRQTSLQNPDFSKPPPPPPKVPFSCPPQNLLLRQPICEGTDQHKPLEGSVLSANDVMGNMNSKKNPPRFDDKDESYIQNWVSNVRRRLNAEENVKKTKEIKINDVQKKLLKYAILIKELKELISDPPPLLDIVSSETLMKKASKLKTDIEELRRYFSEEETLNRIKENLSKRREKRLKRRKTKGERSERLKKMKEERKRIEKEMDEKIKIENEEEKQKLEEARMKREADTVLREVRSKQEDVIRMQKLLQALTSLRDIRKNKGEMHGYVENPDASAFFDKMKKEFETILSDQQKVYRTEEQTLKIMIEESQSSSLSSRKRRPLFAPNLNEVKNKISEIYFGEKRPRREAEMEYERSFLAAEESVEILVQRRKDWDQFLTMDNSGSSIPIGWVVPNLNPSSDWKPYQDS